MLYLIGGASYSGKTIIARRMLRETKTPYFCVDYFVSALDQGAPELGVEFQSPNEIRGKRLWPRIEPMLRNIIEVEPKYVVEGDALLPEGVATLIGDYGRQIRTCFLGYVLTTPERKLEDIREFGGGVNDWIQSESDWHILVLCREMIEFSRFVQSECNSYRIPYVDVSNDFPGGLKKAYSQLIA